MGLFLMICFLSVPKSSSPISGSDVDNRTSALLHRRRRLHLEAISSSLLGDQSRYRFGLLRRLLNPSGEARLSYFAQQRSVPSGNLSVSPSLFCRPHSTGKAILVKLHSTLLLFSFFSIFCLVCPISLPLF